MSETGITSRMVAQHRKYEGFGLKLTNAQWADALGLPRSTTWRYFKQGLSVEQICELRHIQFISDSFFES